MNVRLAFASIWGFGCLLVWLYVIGLYLLVNYAYRSLRLLDLFLPISSLHFFHVRFSSKCYRSF